MGDEESGCCLPSSGAFPCGFQALWILEAKVITHALGVPSLGNVLMNLNMPSGPESFLHMLYQ